MIQVNQVNKTFQLGEQPIYALNHIDLTIQVGEYLSIMGPSGSGKSTLLNMLGLLDVPDDGEYWLRNKESVAINTVPMDEEVRAHYRRDYIGFVFQSYHLIPRLTAAENIELPLVLAGVSPLERQKRLAPIIKRLGLEKRAGHLPNQLSGGQRQRVAIGRAIIMRPKLLLADEPTGNLDSHSGKEVIELLEELNADGITLIIVTHDLDLGARAERKIRMVDGKIVLDQVQPVEIG
ncbi:MAG: ABC transporter ATP-binding protein [Oleispira sp.]|nr:ABC transporter ATP-binding protein [Oleispira sp.]